LGKEIFQSHALPLHKRSPPYRRDDDAGGMLDGWSLWQSPLKKHLIPSLCGGIDTLLMAEAVNSRSAVRHVVF